MEKLELYFDKAKNENEITSIANVNSILSIKEVAQSPNSFYDLLYRNKFSYPIAALVVILTTSIAALLIFDSSSSSQQVFIPEGQKRVFQLVKNIYTHPENSKINLSQFGSNENPEAKAIPIHLRTKFELSEQQLRLLGIRFTDQSIKYEGNIHGKGYISFLVGKDKPVSLVVSDFEKAGVKHYIFYPWFMSDENGRQGVRYKFDNEDGLKMTNSFFFSAIDQLIPIQVNRPGFQKVIFWYSQTPELMSILESSVLISNNDRSSSTSNPTSMEDDSGEKRNTIEIQLFPTITKGTVQVIAKVLKEQDLEISVLNSSGVVMLIPVKRQTVSEGEHNFSMDLSNFDKGLYFVRVTSSTGLITTHRLFKE